jgi:hypothetical protein
MNCISLNIKPICRACLYNTRKCWISYYRDMFRLCSKYPDHNYFSIREYCIAVIRRSKETGESLIYLLAAIKIDYIDLHDSIEVLILLV